MSGFLDLHDLITLVITTAQANAMRRFGLVTVRALGKGLAREGLMCPLFVAAAFRVAPLRISHSRCLLLPAGLPQPAAQQIGIGANRELAPSILRLQQRLEGSQPRIHCIPDAAT